MKKVSSILLLTITALFMLCVGAMIFNEYDQAQIIPLIDRPLVSNADSADSPITPEGKININTASAEDLTLLDGIGEVLSKRIIAYREENGPFQQPEDLLNVKGIGKVTLSKIIDYISVG